MSDYACIFLPFPPSVNHLFPGKARRFKSRAYKDWLGEADLALFKQQPLPMFAGPVNLTFTFGRPDKRARDVTNYLKAPEDLIVTRGIIEDDSLVQKVTAEWSQDVIGVRIEVEAAA